MPPVVYKQDSVDYQVGRIAIAVAVLNKGEVSGDVTITWRKHPSSTWKSQSNLNTESLKGAWRHAFHAVRKETDEWKVNSLSMTTWLKVDAQHLRVEEREVKIDVTNIAPNNLGDTFTGHLEAKLTGRSRITQYESKEEREEKLRHLQNASVEDPEPISEQSDDVPAFSSVPRRNDRTGDSSHHRSGTPAGPGPKAAKVRSKEVPANPTRKRSRRKAAQDHPVKQRKARGDMLEQTWRIADSQLMQAAPTQTFADYLAMTSSEAGAPGNRDGQSAGLAQPGPPRSFGGVGSNPSLYPFAPSLPEERDGTYAPRSPDSPWAQPSDPNLFTRFPPRERVYTLQSPAYPSSRIGPRISPPTTPYTSLAMPGNAGEILARSTAFSTRQSLRDAEVAHVTDAMGRLSTAAYSPPPGLLPLGSLRGSGSQGMVPDSPGPGTSYYGTSGPGGLGYAPRPLQEDYFPPTVSAFYGTTRPRSSKRNSGSDDEVPIQRR